MKNNGFLAFWALLALLLGGFSLEAQNRSSSGGRSARTATRSSAQSSRPARQPSVSRSQPSVSQSRSPRTRYQSAPVQHSRPSVRVRPYRSGNWGHYGRSYGYGYYGGYYNNYGGYYYGGGNYYPLTGLRFNLDLVSVQDRKMVKRGVVAINGVEVGIVNRFDSWQNGHASAQPGSNQVMITLEDGRVFQTAVDLDPNGQILTVYPRFFPRESEK
jgi:hypothetical protein